MSISTERKNYYWLFAQYVYLSISGLITLKLNISHFGAEQFGQWLLLISIWNFGTALDLGFSTAVIKFIAQYRDEAENKLNEIVSTTFVVFVLIGITIFVLVNIFFSSFYLTDEMSSQQFNMFSNIFLIMGAIFLVRYISLFFRSLFEGFSNFAFSSKVNIIQYTLMVISVLIVTYLDLGMLDLALFYLLVPIIALLIFIIPLKRYYPQLHFNLSYFNIKLLGEIFKFSFSIQLTNVFSGFLDPLVKYIISTEANLSFVSVYEIAKRITTSIANLFWTTFKTILPKTAKLKSLDQIQNFILTDCVKVSRFGIAYSGFFFGIILVLISMFIKYWFHLEETVLVLIILAIPETINTFGYPLYAFLIGVGKASFLVFLQFVNLISVGILLLLSFRLLDNSNGLLGIYLSVLFGNSLIMLYIKNRYGISIKLYFKKSKIYNLALINFLLLIAIVIISKAIVSPIIVLSFLSIISLLILHKEIYSFFMLAYSDFLSKS
ncbi:MAG: hypothetical protein COW71_12340 [Ignavibacteriales bacterium CG18_big_fil_WC_8_21_14_2_50_31_20]|nr:oligosaccharide flippase family protein [Ignavibacteria bacterium]PIQ08342.1 MAG: hypothetical protein COW71_12340 [Ignavibacteriales bacterium CG18_big_fil_WC_8_21_14_2_50_31_20]